MISIAADRPDRSRIPRPARPVGGGVPLERYYPVGARRISPARRNPGGAALLRAADADRVTAPRFPADPQPAVAPSGRRFLPVY